MLDFRKLQSDLYYKSIHEANDYLENELYGRDWGSFGITAHCIGHTP